jgi:hypothetical protein
VRTLFVLGDTLSLASALFVLGDNPAPIITVAANNKLAVTTINVLGFIAQGNKTVCIKVNGLRLTNRSQISGILYKLGVCLWINFHFCAQQYYS